MKRRAVVTGLGVVTPLGRRLDVVWERLLKGESGVGPITLFDVAGYRVQFGGQVPWVPEDEDIANPKELKRLDRFTQFAIAAAKDAVVDSGTLRGLLPVLNRGGQSVPPLLFSGALSRLKSRKVATCEVGICRRLSALEPVTVKSDSTA